jgi:hypothetical protein
MGRACSTNGEKRNAHRILVGSPEKRDHWEDQDVGEWTILKQVLERLNFLLWTGLIWLKIRTSGWHL